MSSRAVLCLGRGSCGRGMLIPLLVQRQREAESSDLPLTPYDPVSPLLSLLLRATPVGLKEPVISIEAVIHLIYSRRE